MTTTPDNTGLPISDRIDVGSLARVFNRTTTSYKYIFFQSVLQLLYENGFKDSYIDFHHLSEKMLALAWYPHTYYRLSFGVQDQLGTLLDAMNIDANSQSIMNLSSAIRQNRVSCDQLMRFVPYRLLSAFFETHLHGVLDHKKNRLISHLSNEEFKSIKPLYRLVDDDAIEIHDDWLAYLYDNYSIVESWVLWKWLNYLQKCNPNMPAISNKLSPPPKPHSLRQESNYWKAIGAHMDIECIYTKASLREGELSLDHFLPWSFVGHNRLWNLVPINRSLNSSKGNRIPDVDRYIEGLVQLQHRGLMVAREVMPEKRWRDRTECFIADLNIPDYNDLLDIDVLRERYKETIYPLAQIAANTGFSCQWRASSSGAEVVAFDQRSAVDVIDYQEVSYFPDISIACGHFKSGDATVEVTVKIPCSYRASGNRYFIARASGESMNGGKNPIKDGDYLLLEQLSAENAGSISGKIMVVERQDASGDDQYVLRLVKKRGVNDYYLQPQNPGYECFDATETMRTFACFKAVIPQKEVQIEHAADDL